jgi:hypothetical protein
MSSTTTTTSTAVEQYQPVHAGRRLVWDDPPSDTRHAWEAVHRGRVTGPKITRHLSTPMR